jgi:hypothetical protein
VCRNSHDGPLVKWYDIQQLFCEANFEVLLLLDCCYAAQAARGNNGSQTGIVELLAAAGDKAETPGPGPKSFTVAMIKKMEDHLRQHGQIMISKLHTDLAHRKADLYTTPIHVFLRQNASGRSITLENMKKIRRETAKPWAAAVNLTIRTTEPLTKARMDVIIQWLREEAARAGVSSLHVEKVIETNANVRKFVTETLPKENNPIVRSLDLPVLDQIGQAWRDLQLYTTQFYRQHIDGTDPNRADRVAQVATRFLNSMDGCSLQIIDIIQSAVLMSRNSSDPAAIEQAIEDPASEMLQMRSSLVLRRIICGTSVTTQGKNASTPSKVMIEYKTYGPHQSPKEVNEISARAGLLAEILKADKPEELRCLRLQCCEHQPYDHRFVYQYAIPDSYQKEHISLYDVVSTKRGVRPALEERFTMALHIATAVAKWHQLDWVHQGISAHNVFFLQPQAQKWAFSLPLLHGFSFSRPNAKPSIGRYVEDMKLDIYRHPERQGPSCDGHKKIHDLYSLGVVLLEIGLWRTSLSLVEAGFKDANKSRRSAPDICKEDVPKDDMVKYLKDAVRNHLAHHAGTKYQEAVMTCLTSEFGVHEDDKRDRRLLKALDELVLQKIGPPAQSLT